MKFRRITPAIGGFVRTCLRAPHSILKSIDSELSRIRGQAEALELPITKEHIEAANSEIEIVVVDSGSQEARAMLKTRGFWLTGSIPCTLKSKTTSQEVPTAGWQPESVNVSLCSWSMVWAFTKELRQILQVEVFRVFQRLFPRGKGVFGRVLTLYGRSNFRIQEILELPNLRTLQRA